MKLPTKDQSRLKIALKKKHIIHKINKKYIVHKVKVKIFKIKSAIN